MTLCKIASAALLHHWLITVTYMSILGETRALIPFVKRKYF